MGQGVMVKTSTPSAVSFTVALTHAPARLVDQENLRDHTILREAMLTVDPVVYHGDINALKNLKGERLREAVIGSTAVYYTPFGRWKGDEYSEDEERPLTAELDTTGHIDVTTVLNWWLPTSAPTRQDFLNDAKESYYSSFDSRKRRLQDRRLYGVGGSPLRL
jgi:hypothetical protein